MYSVIDVETTGLQRHDRVVEIAVLRVDDTGVGVGFDSVVRPDAPLRLTGLHGIDASIVAAAPSFGDVAASIYDLIVDTVLIAHNLRFDWSVLREEFGRCGVTFLHEPYGICTAALCRRSGVPAALQQARRHLGVADRRTHHALNDAWGAYELWEALGAPSGGAPMRRGSGEHRLARPSSPPLSRSLTPSATSLGSAD